MAGGRRDQAKGPVGPVSQRLRGGPVVGQDQEPRLVGVGVQTPHRGEKIADLEIRQRRLDDDEVVGDVSTQHQSAGARGGVVNLEGASPHQPLDLCQHRLVGDHREDSDFVAQ